MNKFAASIFVVGGLAAGVFSISAVSVSATEVFLTPSQTRALFGDDISCTYRDTSYVEHSANFHYLEVFQDDLQGSPNSYIVYVSDFEFEPAIYSNYPFVCHLDFSVDLSYLKEVYFDVGFRVNESSWNWPSGLYDQNKIVYYTDYDTGVFHSRSDYCTAQNIGGGYFRVFTRVLTGTSSYVTWNFTEIPVNLQQNDFFSISFNDGEHPDNFGVFQNYSANSYDGQFYFCIRCPMLTDGYTDNTESSGGGSESSGGGYDGPDYTNQLALILAKLDLIINNDFNIDVDLTADLSELESRVDGVNSRLDGVNTRLDGNNSKLDGNNSRLDGVNSRLDGVNSRLDGVNSRLDNISGELHDLNSAPSETLPNTGGENSEFEHQAEMYMSDFRNEFEDSENQVFEVIDKGTGFLGFVRQFIISSHLAQILPLVALLFIAHYVIFERGG